MKIFLTGELTPDIFDRLNDVINEVVGEFLFFENKSYGKDINEILIGAFCMDKKMEAFFKPRKPIYRQDAKDYVHKGMAVSTAAGTFIYELRLDYLKYKQCDDVRSMLLADILQSFQIIAEQKKIQDFNLLAFSNDFRQKFEIT